MEHSSITVETKWCTEPKVFSKWNGSVIAYGINDEGDDWVSEVYFDGGKVYANPEYSVEHPDGYISMDRIKAVALDLVVPVRNTIVKEIVKSELPKNTIPTTE